MPAKTKEGRAAAARRWRAKPGVRERSNALTRVRQKQNKIADWRKFALWTAKSRAKLKGLEFNISPDDFAMPTHCPVFGVPLVLGVRHQYNPSLDRIDNTKGYITGNVRVISHRANALKGDASIEDLRKVIAYMEQYL